MFGLSNLAFYGIIAAIIISLGTVAIYQWRADIKQVAYDKIFRQMAENELKEKDKEIQRFKDLAQGREEAVAKSIAEKRKAEAQVEILRSVLKGQSLNKEPLSTGYGKSMDLIQDYGREPEVKK
jgi:Flp pilus assembly protein TadB